eukprot:8464742-Lingulodinium_polyedra.AAC.1
MTSPARLAWRVAKSCPWPFLGQTLPRSLNESCAVSTPRWPTSRAELERARECVAKSVSELP